MARATSLVKAYLSESIPTEGGFIVTAFFQPGSQYAIYEVTAYKNVKDVYRSDGSFIFKTDGSRTHMLVEPATYPKKHIEPSNREDGKSIPYRFNDMTIYECVQHEKAMIPNEPIMLHTSFTILEHDIDYFSFIFFPTDDVYIAIRKFIADSLYNDCSLTKRDSTEIAATLLGTVKKFTVWE